MRTSNKVLLAAVAALMALFLAFVLVMGFTTRDLLRQRGTTACGGAAAWTASSPWPSVPRPSDRGPAPG